MARSVRHSAATSKQKVARTYVRLGLKLAENGRTAEAHDAFGAAIQLAPDWEEPHFQLGCSKLSIGDLPSAEAAFRATLNIRRSHIDANQNLGIVLRLLGRYEEAAKIYRWLTSRRPQDAAHWRRLSVILSELWKLEAAESAVRRALHLAPGDVEAQHSLSLILSRKGDWEEAITSVRRALTKSKEDAHCHGLLALALLTTGQFTEGWREFEWRNRDGSKDQHLPGVTWKGEPLSGKTLLLFGEQGLGDMIQFSRYATQLAAQGARVILAVDKKLERILSTITGVSSTVTEAGALPRYDFHVSMMSVPHLLGTELHNIPNQTPYVTPPPQDVMRWSERLRGRAGLKIGLAWAGGSHLQVPSARSIDKRRSIPLSSFLPIISLKDITIVSLQKDREDVQPGALSVHHGILDFMPEIDDFCQTAALIENLDLVISVDTSVAHMAGALGKPVWLLSRCDGCWRWLLDREDSPWYPKMKIYRQKTAFFWDDVIQVIHVDLCKLIASSELVST